VEPLKPIHVEISVGELMDKITILEIKKHRLLNANQQRNVCRELEVLCAARERLVPMIPELERHVTELRTTNETVWEIEDEIRDCERRQDFGARFVELARAVYRNNDRRAAIKRSINELVGSRLLEEKSHPAYD
jgi:hypothetical protein